MFFHNILSNAWTFHYRRTCCLIFFCEVVALTNFLCIGYVYVHVYVPNYNAKRFPRVPVVCSTISDRLVEQCELPQQDSLNVWNFSKGHPEQINYGIGSIRTSGNESMIKTNNSNKFQWSSCGEFCSPDIAEGKGCRQVLVEVRSPGSELRLVKCRDIDVIECGFRISRLYEFDGCGVDSMSSCTTENKTTCLPLDGLFTCHLLTLPPKEDNSSTLECTKITTSWKCNLAISSNTNPGAPISVQNCHCEWKNCLNKPGLHFCENGTCILITNLKEMCTNTNKCEDIPLHDKNVIINHNNEGTVITARCSKGFDSQKNTEVWPRGFKNRLNPKLPPALLINCNHIRLPPPTISTDQQMKEWTITLRDCVNGTLLENVTLPMTTSLKDLQSMWHEALTHEDFLLDPIDQKHAPPESKLSLFTNVRIYHSDFYKTNGCILQPPEVNEDTCTDFYDNYARLPGHFRGQSLFPCYCRSTSKGPPYCVIGDRDIFMRNWEDVLVQDWLTPYKIFVLTFLSTLLGVSLIVMCVLLFPLLTDSIVKQLDLDVFVISRRNSQVVVGVVDLSPKLYEIRSRRSSMFLTPVTPFNLEEQRG